MDAAVEVSRRKSDVDESTQVIKRDVVGKMDVLDGLEVATFNERAECEVTDLGGIAPEIRQRLRPGRRAACRNSVFRGPRSGGNLGYPPLRLGVYP